MSGRIMRIAHARLRFSSAYDSDCTIQRGGVAIATLVPCLVSEAGDRTQQLEGQNIPAGAFIVAMPVTTDIRQGDYIIERGRVLEALIVMTPKSFEVNREAVCLQIGTV